MFIDSESFSGQQVMNVFSVTNYLKYHSCIHIRNYGGCYGILMRWLMFHYNVFQGTDKVYFKCPNPLLDDLYWLMKLRWVRKMLRT